MANRLAGAVSPYLRSHSENPVDWWEWGTEAFTEAVERDVPVLVSIGYSTCHWCHVMARESFSDPVLAEFLNANFVAIKVDREEFPDVDATYMAAAGVFTEHLGWPLNVFLTPGGLAFFAGTYWPPQAMQGHPAFRQVLEAVLNAWRDRRIEVEGNAAAVASTLGARPLRIAAELPGEAELSAAVSVLVESEDREFGGLGAAAPKFPIAPTLTFLLGRGSLGDEPAQALAERTLDAMAASDLRDPVEGGFFRYSTRRDWTEPHYERMLYDNAQLLGAYARAGRREIAEGIAGFLTGVMQLESGGFASAQDSESTIAGKRVEGAYYQLDAEARSAAEPPPLDEKVLTGWNGLAIEALALAGTVLERPEWLESARRSADFLIERHVGARLLRASIGGVISAAPATLEDYGMLASGLLQLAASTGEARYAVVARTLVDDSIAAGGDSPFGVPGGIDPVLRSHGLTIAADPGDGPYPSGVSAMASAANTLYLLTADSRYRNASESSMRTLAVLAVPRPASFGASLAVMAGLAAPISQLVVVGGEPESDLAGLARSWHRAGAISSVVTEHQADAFARAGFELFEGRSSVGGKSTAYHCLDFVCRLPVTAADELVAGLARPAIVP